MSCRKCYNLLKDLDLQCLQHNKLCSEYELRLDLKKAYISIHPDKNPDDPLAHDKFTKYSECIKYLVKNYSCYKEKNTHCNSVMNSFRKGYTTNPVCIKFRKKTSKSTGDCPSGYYIRKGYTAKPTCKFPHKNLKLKSNESIDDAIQRFVNDPVINRFYYKIYHGYSKYDIPNSGNFRISKNEIDTVKHFKPLYKCKDFFELKYPERLVTVHEYLYEAEHAKKEYHRLHPELTWEYIEKRYIFDTFRVPKNPKFYTDKKTFIKYIEKNKYFIDWFKRTMKNDGDDIKMPDHTDFSDIYYKFACLEYSFETESFFQGGVDISPYHIRDGDKIYYKYNDDLPPKLLVKISVKEFVDLNWEEIKIDLYDKTIKNYKYCNEYFEKYCQDFTRPPINMGYTFSVV